MDDVNDAYEYYSELSRRYFSRMDNHPEFEVVKHLECFEIFLIDEDTGERLKSFGVYNTEEEAEDQAIEFQRWHEADGWE
jgi:hypothetical protein